MKRDTIQTLLVILFSGLLLSTCGVTLYSSIFTHAVPVFTYYLFGGAALSYGILVSHGLLTRD